MTMGDAATAGAVAAAIDDVINGMAAELSSMGVGATGSYVTTKGKSKELMDHKEVEPMDESNKGRSFIPVKVEPMDHDEVVTALHELRRDMTHLTDDFATHFNYLKTRLERANI
jgi:hypothetical protein